MCRPGAGLYADRVGRPSRDESVAPRHERDKRGENVMDVEIEAPVDELEALDAVEDEDQLGDAVMPNNPSKNPTAC